MIFKYFVNFSSLYFAWTIAYPGESIIERFYDWYLGFGNGLALKSFGSECQSKLDQLYTEYFSAKDNLEILAQKIAIYSHIYPLTRKIEQNKEILKELSTTVEDDNHSKEHILYDRMMLDFTRLSLNIYWDKIEVPNQLCLLLRLKYHLFRALTISRSASAHSSEPEPICTDPKSIAKTLFIFKGRYLFPFFNHLYIYLEQLWKELLDADGIVELEKLLKMEYFSPVDNLSESSSSESSTEEGFADAEEEFDEQKQKAEIRRESPEHSDPEKETLEQRRNRKKMLKEAKKLRAKQIPKQEKRGKQKKVQKFIGRKGVQEDPPAEEEPAKVKKSLKTQKNDPSMEHLGKYYQNWKSDGLKFGRQDEASTSRVGDPLKNNTCLGVLKQLGIDKVVGLAENVFMQNLYKIIENKCVEYLHISLFVRSIQAKMCTIEMEDENYGQFVEKWAEFMEMKLAQIEDAHFMLDKLYFVHKELDGLFADPSDIAFLVKINEILEETKMKKVGKKSEIQLKQIADETRVTQFGAYTFEEYKQKLGKMQRYLDTMVVRS